MLLGKQPGVPSPPLAICIVVPGICEPVSITMLSWVLCRVVVSRGHHVLQGGTTSMASNRKFVTNRFVEP